MVIFLALLMLFSFNKSCAEKTSRDLSILHLSLHKGCINDFQEVAKELSLNVTSWYIHDNRTYFDPIQGNGIYNITHALAQRVWEKHQAYFESFDVIITSDTAPLSRIFLQNSWQKPLIIWICNRFDYADSQTAAGQFPDQGYYELFKKATFQKNVKIVSYTPYEHHYARSKGIEIGTQTIRPIGCAPKNLTKSAIPSHINKSDTLFLYPRLPRECIQAIDQECKKHNVQIYTGSYNGPDDLTDFKGILYFPYAWSNLALFENLQRGVVHFVPSLTWFRKNVVSNFPIRSELKYIISTDHYYLCEWYNDDFKNYIVYFDSWQDLAEKVNKIDYTNLKERIIQKGLSHRDTVLSQWHELFKKITTEI